MNQKTLKRLLSLAAVLALVVGAVIFTNPGIVALATGEVTGEQNAQDAAAAVTTEAGPMAIESEDQETVLAVVNGIEIKVSEVKPYYDYILSMYASYNGADVTTSEVKQSAYEYAMSYYVSNTIIMTKASEMGVSLTDEEKAGALENYNQALADYEAEVLAAIENPTDTDKQNAKDQTLAMAAEQGYTLDVVEKDMLIAKFQNEIVKDVTITDDDVQAFYDDMVAKDKVAYENDYESYQSMSQLWMYYGEHAPMYVPEGIRGIKHILLNVSEELLAEYEAATASLEESLDETETTGETVAEATATPETTAQVRDIEAVKADIIASVQPTVDEIMAKFNAGTSFDDLVVEYGQDPGMTTEPAKTEGYYMHLDTQGYDKAFKDAAFNDLQKVGDISGPVPGSFGVHILYYAGDIPSGPVVWTDEAREASKAEVLAQKQSTYFGEQYTIWEAAATVEFK